MHLFPQEASHTESAALVETQAEQAKEHNKKQDDVGGKGDKNVKLGNVQVDYQASRHHWFPYSANLERNESQKDRLQFSLTIYPHNT